MDLVCRRIIVESRYWGYFRENLTNTYWMMSRECRENNDSIDTIESRIVVGLLSRVQKIPRDYEDDHHDRM